MKPPLGTAGSRTEPCAFLSSLRRLAGTLAATLLLGVGPAASASTAYGTLNNFDCVNDTGVEAHGFEIELDDVRSRDITYTYDYNHYGIPKITEDLADPLHPRVFIRYAASRNPDGTWTAYTAVPSGPILPTDGHQFTDPTINFGGEHFGAGYYGAPSAVKYNWLIDDGTGALVHGPPVYVSTPTFVYQPPVPAQPVPQVQAVIVPPPPPAPPVLRFGVPTWVKDIKTTTHNTNKVELVDLRDPDPANPGAKDWANGEPAEVETEWRILQTEFANDGNPKGELKGIPEDLPGGDEVITRRYEFFKYVGPVDAESGEAMADQVGPDGIHGVGTVTYNDHFDAAADEWVEVTVDLSTVEVVGEFFGAQMSGFDVAPALGVIDHIPDGEVNVPYAERTVVVAGGAAFFATTVGTLPDGTSLDGVTGIFSGTPAVAGTFTFTVTATDLSGSVVTKDYTVTITGEAAPPVLFSIATSSSPADGGVTAGGGSFEEGTGVTVSAAANPGFNFVRWTEGGVEVSTLADYSFPVTGERSLVAVFEAISYVVSTTSSPVESGTTSGGGTYSSGRPVTVTAVANPGYAFVNWTEGGVAVSATADYSFAAEGNRALVANFVVIQYTITTAASPVAGGTTSGGGTYSSGSPVTVTAVANPGYAFVNWTEGGVAVSATAAYTFPAGANRSLVANFAPVSGSGSAVLEELEAPRVMIGGSTGLGEVELTSRAPAGGITVRLISANPGVISVPPSVRIPAGKRSAVFRIRSFSVTSPSRVDVSASVGDSIKTVRIQVRPQNRERP
ncbi:MAG: putative Ig domain-containing protein [Verrucomicrobiales bacterium]|nr:putative Ig domain-containing protein [Verrucomicrobiales bacterium]